MINFTHIRDWFKSMPGKITLLIVGFVAVLAIVIFNQQIVNLLSLIGSKADTDHTIVVNGTGIAPAHLFFEGTQDFSAGGYDGRPDKAKCFKIENGKLMLNDLCPQVQITSLEPTSGPLAGCVVTIQGTGFVAGTKVSFGDSEKILGQVGNGGTALTVTSPARETAGSVQVHVFVPGGPTADSLPNAYTYTSAPAVVSINPNVGDTGQVVNITGSGFVNGTGLSVLFGSNPATNVVFIDGANLTATAPAGTGNVHVIVTNPDGQASAPVDTDRFLYPD
jgi:hypothetical protein